MKMPQAFNEWMRRYTDEPEQFEREWETVARFLSEQQGGFEPTYGQCCAEYLSQLMAEGETA